MRGLVAEFVAVTAIICVLCGGVIALLPFVQELYVYCVLPIFALAVIMHLIHGYLCSLHVEQARHTLLKKVVWTSCSVTTLVLLIVASVKYWM